MTEKLIGKLGKDNNSHVLFRPEGLANALNEYLN